jgi:hypothetical protein
MNNIPTTPTPKKTIIHKQTGREVFIHQWVTNKDKKGFREMYEVLNFYDDGTARVRFLTNKDGYLYTTQTLHKLKLEEVLL